KAGLLDQQCESTSWRLPSDRSWNAPGSRSRRSLTVCKETKRETGEAILWEWLTAANVHSAHRRGTPRRVEETQPRVLPKEIPEHRCVDRGQLYERRWDQGTTTKDHGDL